MTRSDTARTRHEVTRLGHDTTRLGHDTTRPGDDEEGDRPSCPSPQKKVCFYHFNTILHPSLTTCILEKEPCTRFRGRLLFGNTWHLAPPPPPPPFSKTSIDGSFSRVVIPWHNHHHLHPRKRAAYARFRGPLLLGSYLLQPATTTHENELVCSFSTVILILL